MLPSLVRISTATFYTQNDVHVPNIDMYYIVCNFLSTYIIMFTFAFKYLAECACKDKIQYLELYVFLYKEENN